MELLEIQFYSRMRREFESSKNLFYFIFLTAPFVIFLIPAILALISNAGSSVFLRISLVLLSLYVSGQLVKLALGFVHKVENVAWLKHLGFSEYQIKIRLTKIVFIFLSPLTLMMLLVFWFTPWNENEEYSLLVYSAFLISYFGWILANIWSIQYRFAYVVFVFGLYLQYSGISFTYSFVFLSAAVFLTIIRYFNFYNIAFKSICWNKYSNKFMLSRPFARQYLLLTLILFTYLVCIYCISLPYNLELWMLIVILNVTIIQLKKVEEVNKINANYCDFLTVNKDTIWHANKWKHAIFLVLAVVSLLLLSNKHTSLIFSLLGVVFVTLISTFYLVKKNNPHIYMLVNGTAIIMTLVISMCIS